MLAYLTLIFACQLVGELVTLALRIPVPGPVLGMVFLFAILALRGHVPDDLGKVGDGLLSHLSLLFVPAGVGVMLHFRLISVDWKPITAALVIGTLLTIAVTAAMMSWLGRRIGPGSGTDGN